jgi:hypothetical protein
MTATIEIRRRAHRIEAYEATTRTWLGEMQLADGCRLHRAVAAEFARAFTAYLEANGYLARVPEVE